MKVKSLPSATKALPPSPPSFPTPPLFTSCAGEHRCVFYLPPQISQDIEYSYWSAAVLESQAFGPYKQPDYKALLAKNNASVLKAGETLQHNITGCDALNAQPQAGQSLQHSLLSITLL